MTMHPSRGPARRPLSWCLATLGMILLTGCGQTDSPQTSEMQRFTGNWTATGTRQVLKLATGHEAGVFAVSGALMLTSEQRRNLGFRAEAIGFTDSLSGLEARSVWTDEHGNKVFSELRGEHIGAGKAIQGRFTGGTGPWTGISGGYDFRWKRIDDGESGEVVGRVVGLNGWAHFPEAGDRPVSAQRANPENTK